MKFLEKDLEEIIFNADKEALSGKGLHIEGKLFRQKRIGNYGIADLISVKRESAYMGYTDAYLNIDIYELKQGAISVSALLQGIRYAKGVQRYLNTRRFSEFVINLILIGDRIDFESDLIYLTDLIGGGAEVERGCLLNIDFFTYSYDFDGIKFNQHFNYNLKDEGF